MSAPITCAHCQRRVREVIFCLMCGEWCCVSCYRPHLQEHQSPRQSPPEFADVRDKVQVATGGHHKESAQAA
jgi:hypothetical protein